MKTRVILSLLLAFLVVGLYLSLTSADDDEHGHGHGRRRRGGGERRFSAVDNPTYKEQCGACHFAYQPEFLPSASWRKILSNLGDHHDAEVIIEPAAKEVIAEYLEANAADRSSTRRSARIMRGLGSEVPTRITDIPYIRHKHREVPVEVFERKSVGSRSNCVACHITAEQGIYKDDYVRIPD
jgi:hypothetical protein